MGHQSIYNKFRAAGLSEAGALAMLGNFECESNCESIRVQGDFGVYRTVSKQYVADVDSGKISREVFQKDQKGFGLAQWTFFTRKAALYDFAKMQRKSIGDESMQIDFTMLELKSDFPGLLEELKSSNDLYRCTKDVCYRFENPADKNVDARFSAANKIKGEIDLNGGGADPDPVPDPVIPVPEYWPPRGSKGGKDDPGLCICMNGKDVEVLQAVLKARGWPVHYIDGNFSAYLEDIVKDFQKVNGLAADGIVGPMTWGKLLERG